MLPFSGQSSSVLIVLAVYFCFPVEVRSFCPNRRLSYKLQHEYRNTRDRLQVSLDEWAEERADRMKEEAKTERPPSPPPNFDPTQFDIWNDAKDWSQNINNPYYAAKVAAEHQLLKEEDQSNKNTESHDNDIDTSSPSSPKHNPNGAKWGDVVSYQSKTDDLENPWT